jgi:hypothetical protein
MSSIDQPKQTGGAAQYEGSTEGKPGKIAVETIKAAGSKAKELAMEEGLARFDGAVAPMRGTRDAWQIKGIGEKMKAATEAEAAHREGNFKEAAQRLQNQGQAFTKLIEGPRFGNTTTEQIIQQAKDRGLQPEVILAAKIGNREDRESGFIATQQVAVDSDTFGEGGMESAYFTKNPEEYKNIPDMNAADRLLLISELVGASPIIDQLKQEFNAAVQGYEKSSGNIADEKLKEEFLDRAIAKIAGKGATEEAYEFRFSNTDGPRKGLDISVSKQRVKDAIPEGKDFAIRTQGLNLGLPLRSVKLNFEKALLAASQSK